MKRLNLKKNLLLISVMLLLTGFISEDVLAQKGRMGKNAANDICMNLPGLSDEQKEQISDLRTEMMTETLEIRNKINVNKAELRLLTTGDAVDMKTVENKIDEIAGLRAQMMKKHAAHRQDVRSLLNDKQKAVFDLRGPGFGMGMDRGKPYGKGKGQGKGMRGQGPGPYCPWQDQQE